MLKAQALRISSIYCKEVFCKQLNTCIFCHVQPLARDVSLASAIKQTGRLNDPSLQKAPAWCSSLFSDEPS